jgi:hypothetical protein
MVVLPSTHIYLIFFLTLRLTKQTNNGKNDQRIWWQREVRFEGCYDEAREKGRQEGREDGEERCVPEDEEEIIFILNIVLFKETWLC